MSNEVNHNIDIILQLGDCVLLESNGGFLQSQGFTKPGLFIQFGKKNDINCHRNLRDFVYQIQPRQIYDALKEYNNFMKQLADEKKQKQDGAEKKETSDDQNEIRLGQLKKKLAEERSNNEQMRKRRTGERVTYGDEVQLVHYDSGMFVEASKTCADFDKSSNLVRLVDAGSKGVYFIIEPRYKYRSEGQFVTYGDVVTFKHIKTGYYLHITDNDVIMPSIENLKPMLSYLPVVYSDIDKRSPPNKFAPTYEINCSSSKSKFNLRPYRNFESDQQVHVIKGGQVVRLQHSETTGYVCSDDADFDGDGLAEVFLWTFKGKHSDVEQMSSNSLFELEIVVNDIDENIGQYAQYSGIISNPVTALHGGMHFRLRHLNTGRLVVMQQFFPDNPELKGTSIKTVGLSEHYPNDIAQKRREKGKDKVSMPLSPEQSISVKNMESNSIFRLVSTGVDADNRIRARTSVQIQHVESKSFIIQDSGTFKVKKVIDDDPISVELVESSRSHLKDKEYDEINASQIRKSMLRRRKTMDLSSEVELKRQQTQKSFNMDKEMLDIPQNGSNLQGDPFSPASHGGHSLRQQTRATVALESSFNQMHEELDTQLFQIVDDALICTGTRSVIGFAKEHSLENAFFIIPEPKENLARILYVHASVNLLNSFLPEIASYDLGTSIERVNLIEGVLQNMLDYLDEENDPAEADKTEQEMLDMPYSLQYVASQSGKKRLVKEKQKLMRECRVIEACVNILHVPFAQKVHHFKEMTQDKAITSICKLTYLLLGKIVAHYDLNEVYASQWIGLYLQHVLDTTSHNQIGADLFCTILSNENHMILKTQFKPEKIKNFITQSQRNAETPRLLQFLTALCSCQGAPVRENQNELLYHFSGSKCNISTPVLDLIVFYKEHLSNNSNDNGEKRIESIKMECKRMVSACQKSTKSITQLVDIINKNYIQSDETRQKFMSILRKQKNEKEIKICININTGRWEKFSDFVNNAIKIKSKLEKGIKEDPEGFELSKPEVKSLANYNSFLEMLNLFAEMSLGRNEKVQEFISQYFELKLINAILENSSYPAEVRLRMLRLMRSLYLDVQKFNKIEVPSETVIWDQIPQITQQGEDLINAIQSGTYNYLIKTSKTRVPGAFRKLQLFCSDYLKQTKGTIYLNQITTNEMTVEVLEAVHFMLTHGFYEEQDQLIYIATQVVTLLNGSNDLLDSQAKIGELGIQRYFQSPENDLVVLIKEKACDILNQVSQLETDTRCSVFISKLKQDIEEGADENEMKSMNMRLLYTLNQAMGFEKIYDSYVCILFDTMLYRYPELSKRIYTLLVKYFLRKRTAVNNLNNIQILENIASTKMLNEIKELTGELKQAQSESSYWMCKHTATAVEAKQKVRGIFDQLERFCIIEEDNEVHSITNTVTVSQNIGRSFKQRIQEDLDSFILFDMRPIKVNKESQKLMRDFKIDEIALYFIKMTVDRQTNFDKHYLSLIKQCYRFLIAYVRNNLQNQLRLYDDLDTIMRGFSTQTVATLLVYEIFKNNKKFLTLNVSKYLRQIVSYSEEQLITSPRKGLYLKLLEVFCRFEDKLVLQNQTELIIQFTLDTSKSNVLYLFKTEGAKEFSEYLSGCLTVNYKQLTDRNIKDSENSVEKPPQAAKGAIVMNQEIFNMIQLLELAQLCTQGKAEIAELKCRMSILSFSEACNILEMAEQFFPLKNAILNYVTDCCLDCHDPSFLKKPNKDEQEQAVDTDENEESDILVLLKYVENIKKDIESYLSDSFIDHDISTPTGRIISNFAQAEEYIFITCVSFIRLALKRKNFDVGAFDMKFFNVAENLAALYYHKVSNPRYKLSLFNLLSYIRKSSRHSKYLDNVRHPAKKLKDNEEQETLVRQLEILEQERQQNVDSKTKDGGTKSSNLQSRILQITGDQTMKHAIEDEFEDMVKWITRSEQKIQDMLKEKKLTSEKAFENVKFKTEITSILTLLDANLLEKPLQINGIRLLRKIIEVENTESSEPSADWDGEEIELCDRRIKFQQDKMLERGVIPFLCKQMSDSTDQDIQEECMLACVAMLVGGNPKCQQAFYEFMVNEDEDNMFLKTLHDMLQRFFDMTKKYLTEKNAKLEMIQKVKKQQKAKEKIAKEMSGEVGKEVKAEVEVGDEEPEEQSDDDFLGLDTQAGEAKGEEVSTKNVKEAEDDKFANIQGCTRVVRLLQLMCEGHFTALQNHLRCQLTPAGVKNPNSIDFIAKCSNMLSIYVKSYVNQFSTILGNQLIEALIEFVQGPCRENQNTLVDTKVIDCGRDLLSQGNQNQDDLELKGFNGDKKELLDGLKSNAVKLFLSILEGPVDDQIFGKVANALGDFQIVVQRMLSLYEEFLTEQLGLSVNSAPYIVQSKLDSDVDMDHVEEGFDIYSLLNLLGEVIERVKESLALIQTNEAYKNFYRFYKFNTGKIEVNIEGDIQLVFFRIQPKCWFLTDITQKKFIDNVPRETQSEKCQGLLTSVPSFIEEMEHIEHMSKQTVKLPPQFVTNVRDASTVMAVLIALVIVSYYKYDFVLREDGAYDYKPYIQPQQQDWIKWLGYMQAVSSCTLLLGFCVNSRNLVIQEGWRKRIDENQYELRADRKRIEEIFEQDETIQSASGLDIGDARLWLQIAGPYNDIFMSDGKRSFGHVAVAFEYYWISLSHLIKNGNFIFSIQYLAFSLQGMLQSPVFYAFHLLDIVERLPTLKDVIKSVTMNIQLLGMTAMLGVILVYIYGVMGFLFIPDLYFDEGIDTGLINKAGDSICMSLLHCFLSTFNYGVRTGGGMGEFLPAETGAEYNYLAYNIRFFFDVSFFLMVITILLNVIFGIIIDTFAQLREKADNTKDDKNNICFICGLSRQELDRDTEEGFDFHNEQDHEIWNYVYFLIHLDVKPSSDMNGVESTIKEKVKNGDNSWFPLQRCLKIDKDPRKADQSEEANELDVLAREIKFKFQRTEEAINNLEALLN